jgi:hypothetical protein
MTWTWTGRTQPIYWPLDLLPADIPEARILAFGYDTRSLEVADYAKDLAYSLGRLRKETETVRRQVSGESPIYTAIVH